jgi:uncharacterized protein (DUF4415 family)
MTKMGLTNKTTPAFESEDGKTADAAAQPSATASESKPEAAATTAVGTKQNTSVAVSAKVDMRVMDKFKDAMRVEYNTLNQVIASNGNFLERESKTVMGDEVVFQLLSFQDSFVVDPGDDNAPDEMVRYSDDGVTCSDGTNVEEHLKFLKGAGFTKARLKQRSVVVGAIEASAKASQYNGTLMQFDLSPKSRTQWQRYMANVAYGLHIGKYTEEQVLRIKAVAKLATAGTDTYTQATFEVAP